MAIVCKGRGEIKNGLVAAAWLAPVSAGDSGVVLLEIAGDKLTDGFGELVFILSGVASDGG